MFFYHHTTSENAGKILATPNGLGIKGSDFHLKQYIDSLFTEDFLEQPSDPTHSSFSFRNDYTVIIDGIEETYEVKWLGNGLYCFAETNLDAARQYNEKKLDTVLKVTVKPDKCTEDDIFNMTNRKNTLKLIKFLKEEVPQIFGYLSEAQKVYTKKLQEILLATLNNNFRGAPHAAGILIELFLVIYNTYKVVKCSFMLGGSKPSKPIWIDEYIAIKDLDILEKVELV